MFGPGFQVVPWILAYLSVTCWLSVEEGDGGWGVGLGRGGVTVMLNTVNNSIIWDFFVEHCRSSIRFAIVLC